MVQRVSINADEKEPLLLKKLRPDSLLDEIYLCDCGTISFLEHSCRNCGERKRKDLKSVMINQYKAKRRANFGLKVSALLITAVMGLLYLVFLSFLGPAKVLGEAPFWGRFIIQASGGLCVLSLLYQLFLILWKLLVRIPGAGERSRDAVLAGFMMDDCGPNEKKESGNIQDKWIQLVGKGYKEDVKYLIESFDHLTRNEQAAIDSYEEIYTRALKLSYYFDNQILAMLRLRCLDRIELHPGAYTDLTQIMRLVPSFTLVSSTYWKCAIKCLNNMDPPYHPDLVRKIMDFLLLISEDSKKEQIIVDVMCRCGAGAVYPLMKQEHYRPLVPHFHQAKEKNELFAFQLKRMQSGGEP